MTTTAVTAVPEQFHVLIEDEYHALACVGSTTSRVQADAMASKSGGFVTTTSRWSAMVIADLPYEAVAS